MIENIAKRRKYVGVGGDHVPSLGVLEGDILRLLWDAGSPQTSVQVYEAMFQLRREEDREMQSPSTIAVTLSRMVEKGLLTVERVNGSGKGYYEPLRTRAEILVQVMDDVAKRLTGKTFECLLQGTFTSEHISTPGQDLDATDMFVEHLRHIEITDIIPAAS